MMETKKEKAARYHKKYRSVPKNRERDYALNKKYHQEHPEQVYNTHHKAHLRRMLDYKWRLSKLWDTAKERAKVKKIPFEITKDDLIGLYEQADGCCSITKRPFDLTKYDMGRVNPSAPSIDRIDSKLGYVKSNIRLIVFHLNVAFNEWGPLEFKKLIKDYLAGTENE